MNNVKIFKTATTKSILDIRSALEYYQRSGSEEIYKGNVIFTINEYGGSKEQIQAFVPKATVKTVLGLIQQHYFPSFYPTGFSSYGGSVSTKRARVLSIRFDPNGKRFIFQIDEGPGQIIKNGAIKMIRKEKSVQSYLSYEETLKMSYEVLDFIRHAELLAMAKGKPLNTIMHFQQQNNII